MSGGLTVAWVHGGSGYYAVRPDGSVLLVNPVHRGRGFRWSVERAGVNGGRVGLSSTLDDAFVAARHAYWDIMEGK